MTMNQDVIVVLEGSYMFLMDFVGQTIALAESVCGIGSAPWLYENYPMPCNPNPPSSCPPNYTCKSRLGSKLYFCCIDVKPTTSSQSSFSTSSFGSSSASPSSPISSSFSPSVPTSTAVPSKDTLNLQHLDIIDASIFFCLASVCLSSAPYLLNGQPLMCIGSDLKSCPEGYMCEQQNILPKFSWTDQQPLGNISFCCSIFVSSTSPRPTTILSQGDTSASPSNKTAPI